MKSIGKWKCGSHNPGFISGHVQGKTISGLYIQDEFLVIATTDNHHYRVGWQDKAGNILKGEPFLENLDIKLILPTASINSNR